MARQATEVERKLQTSNYDSERKGWDLDEYIALHKEQHAIMKSLTEFGYMEWNHFLQGIKSTELEAVVNVVWAQPEKNGTDIAKTRSQLVRSNMAAFIWKVECK